MPRQPRIDLPGHLYHVIGRGIEQRDIFVDQKDYSDFLTRLEEKLSETGGKCFAFSLLPNHFHLLILRGHRSLSEFMRRLMTGYAVRFNRRYQRTGHLFQNRYKAILCDREPYFLELVAYIHLNPLRAGFVRDLQGLREYKWCGHSVLLGRNEYGFLDKESILKQFGGDRRSAARKYEAFVGDRVARFKHGELSGGSASRSLKGIPPIESKKLQTKEEEERSDERILGDGDFVNAILRKVQGEPVNKVRIEEIMKHVEKDSGVRFEEIMSKSQTRRIVKARAMYCYLAKERCGVNGAQLMKQLRLTSGAISQLVYKGRKLLNG